MTQESDTPVRRMAPSRVWLQRIGTLGSLLALAILGASMLLRLTTVLSADGQPLASLPTAPEYATRLVHRLAASGVAILALCAVVLCWTQRRSSSHMAKPVAWIVASTVILAVIGPLTPGYRLGVITVVNVTLGMLLLMAFWWLRESIASAATVRQPVAAFSWLVIIGFLLHVATGAAASAWEMHGVRWPAVVHLGSLLLWMILIGALLPGFHRQRWLDRRCWTVLGLLVLQLLLGYALMRQQPRPIWLSYSHAMLAPVLALALVSLVLRGSTRVKT